jgi:hypothetical protein
MKIKLSIVTENDKHFPDNISDDKIESVTGKAWLMLLNMIRDKDESVYIESVEVLER